MFPLGENQRRSPVSPEKVPVFHNKPAAPSRLPDISEYRFSPTEPVNFLPKVSQEKFQFHLHKLSTTADSVLSHKHQHSFLQSHSVPAAVFPRYGYGRFHCFHFPRK